MFCRSLNHAADLLRPGDGAAIHAPERWLLDIARRQLFDYLQECSERDSFTTMSGLLKGELALSADALLDEKTVSALVLRAIDTLSPEHRALLRLDLMKKLPEEEIRKSLDIPDQGLFRALKVESFAALRSALQALINKGIDTLFY